MEKLDIIELVQEGKLSRQAIALRYGIGKSTVHDIHKRRDSIRMYAAVCGSDEVVKRRRVERTKNSVMIRHEETESAEDESAEMIDSIEEFDYQEINDQEYEVVYDPAIPKQYNIVEVDEQSPISKKRKSKTLTFREKYDVIQQVESGAPVTFICESYGIGRTTVYDYMRRKEQIFDFVEKSNDAGRRTFKKSKFPEIEDKILQWCESTDSFTKQEFNAYIKIAIDDARGQDSSLPVSGICGNWSWAKRFFKRHPELKPKLLNEAGFSISNSEYLEENDENVEENTERDPLMKTERNTETVKKSKFLTVAEKLEVLEDIETGASVFSIASKFNVSESTIYDIQKKRFELRKQQFTPNIHSKKVSKIPRYPQLDIELLQWCLKQKNFPLSTGLIADKARCIFDELELHGNFNPSSAWAKKFVMRHPELYEKQGVKVETKQKVTDDESFDTSLIEEVESPEETEFVEAENDEIDYEGEEYLIDESEEPMHETEFIKTEPLHNMIVVKKSDDDCTEIPESIALKSLKILIKYTEQRGHDSMLSQLIDYQSQLEKK
jgi:transposase